VDWNVDWPFIGQEQNGDGVGEPVEEWKVPSHKKTDLGKGIPTSDDFNNETLGIQWQWQANPSPNWYSLSKREGHLSLYTINNQTRDENLMWYAPNLCTQILQAPNFEVTTHIE